MGTTPECESVEETSTVISRAERSTQGTLKGKLPREQRYSYKGLLRNYPGIIAWLKTAGKLIVELSLVVFMLTFYAPAVAGLATPVSDGQPNRATAFLVTIAEPGCLPNLTISNLNELVNKATTEEDKKMLKQKLPR